MTPPPTGDRSARRPGRRGRPATPVRPASPSRLATVTSRAGAPWASSARPTASGGWSGEVSTATLAWASDGVDRGVERAPVGGDHHGVVPGQLRPGRRPEPPTKAPGARPRRSARTGPGPAGPARRSRGRRRPPRTPFPRGRATASTPSSTSSEGAPELDRPPGQARPAGRPGGAARRRARVASARARRAAAPKHSPPMQADQRDRTRPAQPRAITSSPFEVDHHHVDRQGPVDEGLDRPPRPAGTARRAAPGTRTTGRSR